MSDAKTPQRDEVVEPDVTTGKETSCVECGLQLVHASGCAYCPACGWSKCR